LEVPLLSFPVTLVGADTTGGSTTGNHNGATLAAVISITSIFIVGLLTCLGVAIYVICFKNPRYQFGRRAATSEAEMKERPVVIAKKQTATIIDDQSSYSPSKTENTQVLVHENGLQDYQRSATDRVVYKPLESSKEGQNVTRPILPPRSRVASQ